MIENNTIARIYPFQVKFQKILFNSVEIAFCDEGKGDKTIIFIHGLGHGLIGWQKNVRALKKHYRCIAIDLPGYGLSSKSTSYPYSMHFYAECVKNFIDVLNLKNVYLCGHSMGGQIAITSTEELHSEIKGLILCAPAGIEQFTDWEKSLYKNTMMFMDMVSTEENSLKKAIQNSFYEMPASAKGFIKNLIEIMHWQDRNHYRYMIDKCISGMLYEPVEPLFSKIRIPIRIIFGEKDNLIPNKFIHPISIKTMLDEVIWEFKNADYVIIPKSGHFVQWERAKEVNHQIDAFLKSN